MSAILESPYLYLVAWSVGLALFTHAYKMTMRAAGWRNAAIVERTLPLVPVVCGIVSGAFSGEIFGVAKIINGDTVPFMVGAFYGAGAGLVSNGLFKLAVENAPEPLADALRQYSDSDSDEEGENA